MSRKSAFPPPPPASEPPESDEEPREELEVREVGSVVATPESETRLPDYEVRPDGSIAYFTERAYEPTPVREIGSPRA